MQGQKIRDLVSKPRPLRGENFSHQVRYCPHESQHIKHLRNSVSRPFTMSKLNQRSIKLFFEGPKHPRTQESTLEDVENRPSKSARISSYFSNDLGQESSKDSESDLDDLEELIESHFVKENRTSCLIN